MAGLPGARWLASSIMEMHIDSSSFGNIKINGRGYSSDVIIYPDRVDGSWWRKEGHKLQQEDILEILRAAPQILIVGTGQDGRMKIDLQLKTLLEQKGIKLFAAITPEACKRHNDLIRGNKTVVTALHLTC
ncbi:MAG: Mth938-like domain-containing protein [Candidatus Brocadiales bacterium]